METNLKRQYSVLSNIGFVVGETWALSKSLFLYNGLFTILTVIQPFIYIFIPKFLIDELTTLQRISHLTLFLAAMFVLSAITGFFIPYMLHKGKTEIMRITFSFIYKLTSINLSTDYENTEDSYFLNKMESAKRSLHNINAGLQGILNKLFSIGGSVFAFFGYAAIIATLSPYILLFLIASVIVTYSLTLNIRKYEYNQSDKLSEAERVSGYAYELMSDFSYGKEIRIYSLAQMITALYQKATANKREINKTIQHRYLRLSMIDIGLVLMREGVAYAYLIYLFLAEGITIGDFLMYFATVAGFAVWMQTVIADLAHLRGQNMYIDDLRHFVNAASEEKTAHINQLKGGPYTIEFKHVSFKYPNSENYILNNLSLIIPAYQKLAIVGRNGAGKTTFIKLLCRMYKPSQGVILLNGVDIQSIPKAEYFKLLSTVFQEIRILAFSVGENIAIDEHERIDYPKVSDSLEKADLKDKVSTLHKGVHTTMMKFLDDSGVELSGGENQKLAFARAHYKNGDIVILDEPTSALDALAELQTYMTFNQFVGNRSALYISHRLSSTRFCEAIALFENGNLLEYGTHQQLLEKCGKYYEMFNLQASYYTDEEAAKC